MKKLVFTLASTLLLGACSNSSGDSSTSTAPSLTYAATGFKATSDALKSVQSVMPASTAILSNDLGILAAGSIDLIWTTDWIQDPRCSSGGGGHCGQSINFQEYLSLLLDPGATFDNGVSLSVFGKMDKALQTACAVSSLLYGSAGELPSAGTQSITFDAAALQKLQGCQFSAAELATLSGVTMSMNVTATTNTSLYDRKFTLTMGNKTQDTYVRVTATAVNVLAAELEGTQASKTAVALDRATGLVRAEYISVDSTGGGEWHRIYFDPTASRASIMGSSYSTAANFSMAYGAVGQPDAPTSQVAVSAMFKDYSGLTTADSGASASGVYHHYKGCMTQSTGVMATPNTFSCSGGITGADLSANFETVMGNMLTAINASGAPLVGTNAVGETKTVPFTTGAEVFTSAVPVGP